MVMGVVNVTPDSFSDGGRFLDPAKAVEHGVELIAQGAEVIDIGGESTRPGAQPVSETGIGRAVMDRLRRAERGSGEVGQVRGSGQVKGARSVR